MQKTKDAAKPQTLVKKPEFLATSKPYPKKMCFGVRKTVKPKPKHEPHFWLFVKFNLI
jgi:hypothetical protein